MSGDAGGGEAAVAAGLEIAATLAESAIWHGDICAFAGATAGERLGEPVRWRIFDGDGYEGSAGIARLLAQAARIGGDPRLKRAAEGALGHALARGDSGGLDGSLGGGRVGIGLAAMEAGGQIDRPDLTAAGARLCRGALAAAEAEAGRMPLDLLSGLAGLVHAAARLALADPEWLTTARRLGTVLAARGVDQPVGRAWPMPDGSRLCGLAHGAAGVALAFEDLARANEGDGRWPAEADAARQFERCHFDPDAASWADLRSDVAAEGGPPPHPHFWCNGSVGIAHDRLAAHRGRPDCPLRSAEAAAALLGVRREAGRLLAGPCGPGGGYAVNGSQCHGLSGMIDLLVETGDPDDRSLALRLAAFVREDAKYAGYRSGIAGGELTPGLMLGLAGIAWGQLRAALSEAMPPAWTPAPPVPA